MPEPAWRAEEAEWHEQESTRFQAEVAADSAVGDEADRLANLYLQGKLAHERLAD